MPGFHIVAGGVVEGHLLQLVDAVGQDGGVLAGPRQVAEAAAQIQPQRAPVRQEARGAGPVPEGGILPHTPPPVERPGACARVERFGLIPVFEPAGGQQAVDLAVEVEAPLADGDDDVHGLEPGRLGQVDFGREAFAIIIGRPVHREMAAAFVQAEMQLHVITLIMAAAFGAVARQNHAAGQRDEHFGRLQVARCEIEGVDEDVANISDVGDGRREEFSRGEDGVVVPALDAQFLQEFKRVEARGFQVAVQQGLAGPAHLAEGAVGGEEGGGLGEEGLHGDLLINYKHSFLY